MSNAIDNYEKELKRLKDDRPPCYESEDGTHTWVSYNGDGIKRCVDCDYCENILIPVE